MKRTSLFLLMFIVGIFVGALGVNIKSAVSYWRHVPEPSSAATALPLLQQSLNPASIQSGKPMVWGAVFSKTADGNTISGVWECEGPAVIDFTFWSDERLYVLEGDVQVDYLGNQFSLESGDTAIFRAGTTATWNIPDKLKKVWTVHDPGRVAHSLSLVYD